MPRRVLIAGASIAGNSAAWLLVRAGFNVTVIEECPSFRDGGQNVDVRGAAREVLRRMGLQQEALAHRTGERGTAWVDKHDRIVAAFGVQDGGLTADLEILRGDLARILYEPAASLATYRFGDRIAGMVQDGDVARVTFASGATDTYDIVIVAEGVGSSTRELVLPGENRPRWMNATIAYFTIPRASSDTDYARWFNAPGGRSILLRPDPENTTRAFLTLQTPPGPQQDWPTDRQRRFMHERFAGAGWETQRVLNGMDRAEDFAFDVLRQVKMKRWSNGSVVLTGDAAWCATPISGIGSTLAIVGAYVLAGELARTPNVRQAFTAYERIMRPYVEEGQSIPKIAPRLLNPHSRAGVALLHGALRVAALPPIRALKSKLFAGEDKADAIDLPNYAIPVPPAR